MPGAPAVSASRKTIVLVAAAGVSYLGATSALAITQTPLGTPLFFGLAGVCVGAYIALMVHLWSAAPGASAAFAAALIFAALIRVPIAASPVHSDNDMIRYLWDGRIQKLGFNPYAVLPADPQLQWTHTDETRDMPSARHRTPYPPAAQMFWNAYATGTAVPLGPLDIVPPDGWDIQAAFATRLPGQPGHRPARAIFS